MLQTITVDPSTAILGTSISGVIAGDPRLPKDLWPNIVSYLSQESIENVMFVCQYFRILAQPRFFRTLAVRPYGVDRGGCFPRNEVDSRWILQKLEFYSSPVIARHVQICRVSPYCRRQNRHSMTLHNEGDSGRALVDDVFDLLLKCPSLTELDLDCVRLTAENLRQISRIPHLQSVVVSCCSTAALNPVPLGINTVLFKRHSTLTSMFGAGASILLSSLVNADATEILCFMGDELSIFPYDIFQILPMHRLRTLCIDLDAVTRPSLPSFLSQLLSLREIIIQGYSSVLTLSEFPLSPLALPLLEAYEGPLGCINHIAYGRPIRHLRISDQNPVAVLLGVLHGFKSTVDLESLQFQVDRVNITLLEQLFDEHKGFLKLKALSIEFDFMDSEVLTHILPTLHLPPDIEYLNITQSSSAQGTTASSKPIVPKKAYLTRYPALRYAAFAGEGYSWRFDPYTGAPLKSAKSIEDWRHAPLTRAMIQKLCRTQVAANDS